MESITKWEWEQFIIPFYTHSKGGEAGTEFIRFKRDWKFKQMILYNSFTKEIKHKTVV